MTSRRLRAGLLALGLAFSATAFTVTAAPAPAQAAACSGTSGVTVVVDFGSGSTQTACASGDPSTGFAALSGAGFSYQMVSGQSFVCKINGAPGSADCSKTPPVNAYWSYWHAQPGGSWTYSSKGAGSYDPAPGSVEGWAFGAGAKPSVPPPAPSGGGSDGGGDDSGGGSDGDSDNGGGSNDGSGSDGGDSGLDSAKDGAPGGITPGTDDDGKGPSTSGSPSADAPAAAPDVSGSNTAYLDSLPAGQADPASSDGGLGTVSWIVAAVVLAGLAGAAWWRARKRAQAGTD